MVKENSTLGSWMWKKILKYRDAAKGFHKVEVHNGPYTSFWFDNWSSMERLDDIASPRGTIDMGINIHATVAKVFDTHCRRGI